MPLVSVDRLQIRQMTDPAESLAFQTADIYYHVVKVHFTLTPILISLSLSLSSLSLCIRTGTHLQAAKSLYFVYGVNHTTSVALH